MATLHAYAMKLPWKPQGAEFSELPGVKDLRAPEGSVLGQVAKALHTFPHASSPNIFSTWQLQNYKLVM